jgi:hypothetical protein
MVNHGHCSRFVVGKSRVLGYHAATATSQKPGLLGGDIFHHARNLRSAHAAGEISFLPFETADFVHPARGVCLEHLHALGNAHGKRGIAVNHVGHADCSGADPHPRQVCLQKTNPVEKRCHGNRSARQNRGRGIRDGISRGRGVWNEIKCECMWT